MVPMSKISMSCTAGLFSWNGRRKERNLQAGHENDLVSYPLEASIACNVSIRKSGRSWRNYDPLPSGNSMEKTF